MDQYFQPKFVDTRVRFVSAAIGLKILYNNKLRNNIDNKTILNTYCFNLFNISSRGEHETCLESLDRLIKLKR